MGTLLYGEEGQEPFVKRHAGQNGCEYTVCINRKLNKKEYVNLIVNMISGLDL